MLRFKSCDYCAFCRRRLPKPNYQVGFAPQSSSAWEYDLLGYCDIAEGASESHIVIVATNLTDPYRFQKLLVTFSDGRSLSLTFSLEPLCKEAKTVYLVHRLCWKFIHVHGRFSAAAIYNFAQSLHPLFRTKDMAYSGDEVVTELDLPTSTFLAPTGLGSLLRLFSKLPVELQLAISTHCASSLPSSLLTVANRSLQLLQKFHKRHDREYTNFTTCASVDSVCAETLVVFGRKYISLLRFNGTSGVVCNRLEIKGVHFVLGSYGIHAFRVLYIDNSTSLWLGDPREGWHGLIYGSDLRHLHVLHDSLKCIRIDFLENTNLSKTSRIMWDEAKVLKTNCHHRIYQAASPTAVDCFPGWQLCRYLPFFDGQRYITGLTIYSLGHSITGMVAHGQSRISLGTCEGVPVHFKFKALERIVSVWIRIPNHGLSIDCDPNILIITNRDRLCVYGPFLDGFSHWGQRYDWVRLTCESGSDVMGIFCDELSTRFGRSDRFTNIGITQENRTKQQSVCLDVPKIPILQAIPYTKASHFASSYLSISKLDNVRRLRTRKEGQRCTGLLVYHTDDTVDVLGQWDLNKGALMFDIYNSSDGVLTSITFRLLGEPGAKAVDAIFASTGDNSIPEDAFLLHSTETFTLSDLYQPTIMWWFTRAYDQIQPWYGAYAPLKSLTSHTSHIQNVC